jgi:hypothetical protein
MMGNSSSSATARQTPAGLVAKPLSELTGKQKEKVTSELMRIHHLVSSVDDSASHKDKCADKADRCGIEFKPRR